VSLSGTGTQPVSLSPSNSIAFSNPSTNAISSPQHVTVVNNQSVAVNFSSIQVFGSFRQINTCGSSIPAQSSYMVMVAFQPTALGAASGVVSLTDNSSNSPQYINLSGNGVASVASILTYHYGNSRAGADRNETILTPAVVSANGLTNDILCAEQHGGTVSGNEVLRAYDATNLANELYNSDQAGTRDLPGIVGKEFESIIVVNGKVYVPTGQPQLTVFGLLSSDQSR
jgi:hypothetical protein